MVFWLLLLSLNRQLIIIINLLINEDFRLNSPKIVDYKVSFQTLVKELINSLNKYKKGQSQVMRFPQLKSSLLIILNKVKNYKRIVVC